ncbi:MAG: type II toxin-antitoxin system RelE/ParE family toxin [Oscillospiraceae bacterium]|nr:type II toxin-antitoxin system RelE/ParE family toxin [Oscillospiraceae bacterium]
MDLAEKDDKDSRVKLGKIDYYLEALRKYGTRVGEPFVKHIDGDIWELRPLSDRFFFVGWDGDKYILLHHFVKKTKKTPPLEIQKAKSIFKDFIERICNNDEK